MRVIARSACLVILLLALCAGHAIASPPSESSSAPPGYSPTGVTRSRLAQTEADILLIQTSLPWNSSANETVLSSLQYSTETADWEDIETGRVDIFSFPVVLIVNDQVQSFYDSYANQRSRFERYVEDGGTLVFFAASDGWAGGRLRAPLPGGITYVPGTYDFENSIALSSHALVASTLSDGVPLNPAELKSTYCSHGYFLESSLPPGNKVIFRDSSAHPTLVEYGLGRGTVVASTNTWEYTYDRAGQWIIGHYVGFFSRTQLDDLFLYAFSVANGEAPKEFRVQLSLDDALEGTLVNHARGDLLDVVVDVATDSSANSSNVLVSVSVPGDHLGAPIDAERRRATLDEPDQSLNVTTNGAGTYSVSLDLYGAPIVGYAAQAVLRFRVPTGLTPMSLAITGTASRSPGTPVAARLQGRLTIREHAEGIVVTHRARLLARHRGQKAEVLQLLGALYTTAQGAPSVTTPASVVYYADREDASAGGAVRLWSEMPDYSGDEVRANEAAIALDSLIEGWYDRLSRWEGWIFRSRTAHPSFLTIIGGDDILPMYRYQNPGEVAWSSGPNQEPFQANRHGYQLTDSPYSRYGDGWASGEWDMAIGRMLGTDPRHLTRMLSADSLPGRAAEEVVMAAVSGWEVGTTPDPVPPTAGSVADFINVVTTLESRGFSVVDQDGSDQTIEACPTGGAGFSRVHFLSLLDGAPDISMVGGHQDYDVAYLCQSDELRSSDFDGQDLDSWGEHQPLTLMTGCHGGFPSDRQTEALVATLIGHGARGYVGSTAFVPGSPNRLDQNTFGEMLIQHFFERLASSSARSMAVGRALAEAKHDYPESWPANESDHQTLTMFQYYGAPWLRLRYGTTVPGAARANRRDEQIHGSITTTPEGTYILDLQVMLADAVSARVEEDIRQYDLVTIDGCRNRLASGDPVVPVCAIGFLPLPDSAVVSGLTITDRSSRDLAPHDLPSVSVKGFSQSEGGLQYTDCPAGATVPASGEPAGYSRSKDGLTAFVLPLSYTCGSQATSFHQGWQVRVAYDIRVPIFPESLQIDQSEIPPGSSVPFELRLANVGPAEGTADVIVRVVDGSGLIVHEVTLDAQQIPGATRRTIELIGPEVTFPGAYTLVAVVVVDGIEGGSASAPFQVVSGRFTKLDGNTPVAPGEFLRLVSHFENALDLDVVVASAGEIRDPDGRVVDQLLQQEFEVPSLGSGSLVYNWSSENIPNGSYFASITLTSGGVVFGPLTFAFSIGDRNSAPTAVAGPDQVLECSGGRQAFATLDGASSIDPDSTPGTNDDISSFLWQENGETLSDQPLMTASFAIGAHEVLLTVTDESGLTGSDSVSIVVQDTTPPIGRLTAPVPGRCFGPGELPVTLADDFTDSCDTTITRTYSPEGGPSYGTHGDYGVLLTATDSSNNSAQSSVLFTIDTTPPKVQFLVQPDHLVLPDIVAFDRLFGDSDDDAASGAVVVEAVSVDGCVVYDGNAYGDLDGLLLDETLPASEDALCRLVRVCGRREWRNPVIAVTATDCGGNSSTATMVISGGYHVSKDRCR